MLRPQTIPVNNGPSSILESDTWSPDNEFDEPWWGCLVPWDTTSNDDSEDPMEDDDG
jgi:hypothetical protein